MQARLHPACLQKFLMQAHFRCRLHPRTCSPMRAPARAFSRLHAKRLHPRSMRPCMKLAPEIFASMRVLAVV
jgi:hypothetical protein